MRVFGKIGAVRFMRGTEICAAVALFLYAGRLVFSGFVFMKEAIQM